MSQQGPGGYGSPEQPAKKTNPLVFVAVGCALVVVLVISALGILSVVAWNKAKRGGVSAGGSFSAGVELAIDGGAVAFDAGATTGPPKGALGRGSTTCEKAADCCRRAAEKTGANAQTLKSCEILRSKVDDLGCDQALRAYRASPLFAEVCP
jgi:hypothetical protein